MNEDRLGEVCRVCGASPASRHYGGICCSGCKGFFRRSVRFKKNYDCPQTKNCVISKVYRNCCRACRYDKCRVVGLDPKLVHGDWGLTSTNKSANSGSARGRSRKLKGGDEDDGSPYVLPENLTEEAEDRKDVDVESRAIAYSGQDSTATFPDAQLSLPILSQHPSPLTRSVNQQCQIFTLPFFPNCVREKRIITVIQINPRDVHAILRTDCEANMVIPSKLHLEASSFSQCNDFLSIANYLVSIERKCDLWMDSPSQCQFSSTLFNAQPQHALENMPSSPDLSPESAYRQQLSSVIIWSSQRNSAGHPSANGRTRCRPLIHYFDWANRIEDLDEFSVEDKQLLIAKRSVRCIWLLLAFRSALFAVDGVAVGCGTLYPYNPEDQANTGLETKELFAETLSLVINQMVIPLRELGMTETEYALLRVICFFTPVSKLSSEAVRTVTRIQSKYLGAFSELIHRSVLVAGGTAADAMARLGKALVLLAAVEQVAQYDDNAMSVLGVFNLTTGLNGIA